MRKHTESAAALLAGLVGLGLPGQVSADEKASPERAEGTSQLQQELNHGYALLYELVSGLQHADELLLVKVTSDEVKAITDDVAEAMTDTMETLEGMAESDTPFGLEDTGTPRFERETRRAMGDDRVESFAPIVGKTGEDFERTLLLTQAGNLKVMRQLTELLAGAETTDDRKRLLADANARLGALYERVEELLYNQYYCKP